MRATSKLLALALTAALQPAVADVVPLTFEDIPLVSGAGGIVKLLDRYSKSGVEFSGAAWGVVASHACVRLGLWFVPRIAGTCGALELAGDPRDALSDGDVSFTLNFAEGFTGGSSFYYSALTGAEVTVFEGLDGIGKITTINLPGADCTKVPGAQFCNWDLLSLRFSGVARSIVVKGVDESLLLDDFSFFQSTPTDPGRLPEPGSMALAFSALGALGWARKRAAR